MLAAGCAGAFAPPIAVLTRTLWRHRFPDEVNRHMAFSVDSIMIERNFTLGPALIALVIAAFGAKAAFALALVVTFASFIVFLFTPALKYWSANSRLRSALWRYRFCCIGGSSRSLSSASLRFSPALSSRLH